jgi:small neutral amino acid transporter SnatA (MarC family)
MSRNYKKEKRGRVSVATSLFLDTLLALFPFFGDFFLYVLSLGLQKERDKKILSFLFGACGGLLYR